MMKIIIIVIMILRSAPHCWTRNLRASAAQEVDHVLVSTCRGFIRKFPEVRSSEVPIRVVVTPLRVSREAQTILGGFPLDD